MDSPFTTGTAAAGLRQVADRIQQLSLRVLVLALILTALPMVHAAQAEATVTTTDGNLWPLGEPIRVCFQNPDSVPLQYNDAVVDAARQWSAVANVSFIGFDECVDSSKNDLAIKWQYISPTVVGQAYVGLANRSVTRQGGTAMTLSPICGSDGVLGCQRTAVHEFGHVLGFGHGHTHSDYYVGRDGCTVNEAPAFSTPVERGPYVRDSVMNYCQAHQGDSVALSASDVYWVGILYPGNPGMVKTVSDFECNGQSATILGTQFDDDITGTVGDDVIVSLGGADTIRSLTGNDTICAGSGVDRIWSGSGDDTVFAEGGSDRVWSGPGHDVVHGAGGNDQILAGNGNDMVFAGGGDDVVEGGNGNDDIQGNAGDDTIRGGSGNDVLRGSSGVDTIAGEDGNDDLFGGSGNDLLFGGSGKDHFNGQTGGNDLCRPYNDEIAVNCER